MEVGTHKALKAVVLQLVCAGMIDKLAWKSTGASKSNFMKWKRRLFSMIEAQRQANEVSYMDQVYSGEFMSMIDATITQGLAAAPPAS